MDFQRCTPGALIGAVVLAIVLAGCQGEVPVAVEDPLPEESSAGETSFTPLTFEDFTTFPETPADGNSAWSVTDAGIIKTTGEPRGYLYTKKSYGDFTFQAEFRFVPQGESSDAAAMDKYNTGFLIYVPDEHKIWPRSLEVQGRYDLMGRVKKNARDIDFTEGLDDQSAREEARQPVGEWNAVEIVAKDGAVTAYLNGTKISSGEAADLDAGHIGLQAEDFPVEFRNLQIRED